MNSFFLALQFLTTIPVMRSFNASDRQLGVSALFYPLIGLIIGCLLVTLASLLDHLSANIGASLVLILWVVLTGGLHLDGLADCADAWVGGLGDKQRSLEIMKDPAAGPIAVLVLVVIILLKWALLIEVIETQMTARLIVVAMLGRLALLLLMLSTSYIRKGGLGAIIVKHLPESAAKGLSVIGVLIGIYFLGWLAIALMLLTLFIIKYQAYKRLGGVTGDVYGASVELSEVSLLLGFVL